MKHKFEAEFLAFAGKRYPLILFALFAAACGICYIISGLIWPIALVVAPILCLGILGFTDYFVFAGTNAQKAHGMELLKCSPIGAETLAKALRQDLLNKAVFSFALTAFLTAIVLLYPELEADRIFVILYAFAGYATGQLLLRILLFISRRRGLTLQAHMMIVYLVFFLGSLILTPLFFLSETGSIPIILFYACGVEVLSVLSAIWLLSSCKKAFKTTFYDT